MLRLWNFCYLKIHNITLNYLIISNKSRTIYSKLSKTTCVNVGQTQKVLCNQNIAVTHPSINFSHTLFNFSDITRTGVSKVICPIQKVQTFKIPIVQGSHSPRVQELKSQKVKSMILIVTNTLMCVRAEFSWLCAKCSGLYKKTGKFMFIFLILISFWIFLTLWGAL